MIKRYTAPQMGTIWEELSKKQKWLEVEKAVLAAKEQLGLIPSDTHTLVKDLQMTPDMLKRADEIEKDTDHDLIAFVYAVNEVLPDQVKPYFHAGLTSYDIEDTALALQMLEAIGQIEYKLDMLIDFVKEKAQEHKYTYMIGRSHGIHGEPITFGLKLLDWLRALEKHKAKLAALKQEVGIGKLSGAMGTYVLSPEVEELTCINLGLAPAKVSTQVIGRDVHVSYVLTLVQIANSLDRFAIEIRNLARTDIGEVAEYKKPGNKGSSAMPAKSLLRNPIKSENISGLAKVMRSYAVGIMECELLWHERSLDNSSAERILIPDASILLDFMLLRFIQTFSCLIVYKGRMLNNIWFTKGLVFAQPVMLALAAKGMPREEAYALVEKLALQIDPQTFKSIDDKTFQELVSQHEKINELIGDEIISLFDHRNKLPHIDEVFKRFNLKQK